MAYKQETAKSSTSIATLKSDEQSARNFASLVAENLSDDKSAVSLVDAGGGEWQVSVYFCAAPDRETLRTLAATAVGPKAANALRFARVAAKDWVAESLVGLKPVAAGRFVVHGAHDRAHVPVNRIGIEIEASLAFGTGHHGTTRGCLSALDWLCRPLSTGNDTLGI